MQSVSQPLLCLPIVAVRVKGEEESTAGGRKGQISEGWDVSRVHVFSEVSEITGFC